MSSVRFAEQAARKPKRFNWKALIEQHPQFFGLKSSEIDRLLDSSEEEEYEPGEKILNEGEAGDAIFLIGMGSVEVCLASPAGNEVALATLKRPELFGEMAVLERRPRAATIRAGAQTTLLRIEGADFMRLLEEHPEVEFRVLLKLAERLRQINERVLAVKMKDVDEKLRILDDNLKVEIKVFEASLKAAQALFDQTKIRTDEVIQSADRSRTRLTAAITAAGSVAALAVTLFGWFGVKQVADITEKGKQIQAQLEKANDDSKMLDELMKGLEKQKLLSEQAQTVFAQDFLVPELRKALADRSPANVEYFYDQLVKFGPGGVDPDPIPFLDQLERITTDDRGADRRDYTRFLSRLIEHASSEDKLRAHYLLLANMIVMDKPPTGKFRNDKTFALALKELGEYCRQYQGSPLANGELSGLQSRFDDETEERRELFRQVRKLLPTR